MENEHSAVRHSETSISGTWQRPVVGLVTIQVKGRGKGSIGSGGGGSLTR